MKTDEQVKKPQSTPTNHPALRKQTYQPLSLDKLSVVFKAYF